MPELPEVETIKRGLQENLIGKVFSSADILCERCFPNEADKVERYLLGAAITSVTRRGKSIQIALTSTYTLHIHLKMTGQLIFNEEAPDRFLRVRFHFADDTTLSYNDMRKFGYVTLLSPSEIDAHGFLNRLGVEPLEKAFSLAYFKKALQRRAKTSIKAALLDQSVVAGIGNIYADEALFLSKIHPARRVSSLREPELQALHKNIRHVLQKSIDMRGSSRQDYLDLSGRRGDYLDEAYVYERTGQACRRCDQLIQKTVVAGRGTHFCPVCQAIPGEETMQEIVEKLKNYEEVLWTNPRSRARSPFSLEDVLDADKRLHRFASFLMKEFPETRKAGGIIESPLTELKHLGDEIPYASRIFIKQDNALAIAGSVKARGGIYEILKHAEELALAAGLIDEDTDYKIFATKKMKQFLAQFTIQVATTGNLGLSIGIISAHLGFKVKVHMSSDAKAWKKALLRSHGVEVIEYASDYSKAVEKGRKESNKDAKSYFVDDERSANLFLGYAVAALRLKDQLERLKITPSKAEPLYVSIPCGVGGAPGGIAYGLKLLFKDTVKIYFAEPTHAPCMLIGMMSGKHDKVSVYDYGLDGVTIADGLAVGKASSLVGKLMMSRLDGIYTVRDDRMLAMVKTLYQKEGIKVEPSATAGFFLPEHLKAPGHYLFWSTGGSLVPEEEFEKLIK